MHCNLELCPCCKAMLLLTETSLPPDPSSTTDSDVWNTHHASCTLLARAAADGCPFCALLYATFTSRWDGAEDTKPRFLQAMDSTSLGFKFIPDDRNQLWMYHFSITSKGNDKVVLERANIFIVPIYAGNDFASLKATTNTGSEESVELARTWIQTCLEQHPRCKRIPPQGWMPKRILDIGSLAEPLLRLRLRVQRQHTIKYATLSHCWGQLDIKRLQKASLASMTKAISFEELPKTFREAITFARKLTIRYLWIDSLCIIQDSPEDWAEESASMEKIYQYAVCNIAATSAKDGNEGCFFERDPRLAQVCRVRLETSAYKAGTDVFDLIPQELWSESAPLSKRAWVLQEQILAPRIIHCYRTQLFWECHHIGLCEMYPHGIPHDAIQDGYTFNFKWKNSERDFTNYLFLSNGDSSVEEYCSDACRSWDRLVFDYCKRLLTNEQDKLIAISGVARVFEPKIQVDRGSFRYLAGLWGRYLPVQLLWRTYAPPIGLQYPSTPVKYRAPSWSWASVNGSIGCFHYSLPVDQGFMIQILEAETEAAGSHRMGQISWGVIRLRGSLKAFQLNDQEVKQGYLLRDEHIVVFLRPDIPHHLQAGCEIFCLPIVELATIGHHRDQDMLLPPIHGLIIEKTETKGQYKRIGRFETTEYGVSLFRVKTYKSTKLVQAKGALDSMKETHNLSRATSSVSSTEDAAQVDVASREGWVESVITII